MNDATKHTGLTYDGNIIVAYGVKEVTKFEDKEIIVILAEKTLTIRGKNLNVTDLNLPDGKLSANGEVETFIYSGTTITKTNFFKKIFG